MEALLGRYRAGGAGLLLTGAALGLALLVIGLIRINARAPDAAAAPAQPALQITELVTAARPIERGQLIQPGDLKSTSVVGAVPADAIVSPTLAAGKIAITDIQPQQLVLKTLISDDPSGAGLAMLVPAGQRVISIDTTDEIAVAGFLRAGDLVDVEIVLPSEVFGTMADGPDRSESRTLLQNIRVLTVGPTLGQPADRADEAKAKAATESRTITLAMLPEQIGPFTLARKLGRFYLVLRNPNDRAVTATGRAGLVSLRGGDEPRAGTAMRAGPARRQPSPRPIELIVGGQRQIIYPGASGR